MEKKNLEKWHSAMVHFNFFMKNYYKKGKSVIEKVTQLNDDLSGTFGTYLAKHATKYCKKGADLIS